MLSAVILTHNDEKTIERCLKSLKFCDDIIIIDDNSTDKTLELAKRYPVSIIHHSLDRDFAAQRNRALRQSQGKWVLFIDADEQVTKELQEEIKHVLKEPKYEVYYIKRRDYWWGREVMHGEVDLVSKRGFIRLVKKGSGSWKGRVHEKYVTEARAGSLENYLNHYPHPTLKDFIEEVNHYSTIRAHELQKEGHKASIIEIITLPFLKFIYTYFLKAGYKDGARGFVYSFLMSFHSFLVRSKLYQYQHIDNHE